MGVPMGSITIVMARLALACLKSKIDPWSRKIKSVKMSMYFNHSEALLIAI